jgi:hypothetical protein
MEISFPVARIFFIWPSSKPRKRYAKDESMGITSSSISYMSPLIDDWLGTHGHRHAP